MSNIVYDALLTLIPGRQTTTPSGWISFNAPCCVHNGQTRDTRKRGGIKLQDDQARYHCFNCQYATSWKPGEYLPKRMVDLLGWMGMSEEDIKTLRFHISAMRFQMFNGPVEPPRKPEPTKQPLPIGARPMGDWMDELHSDPNFVAVLKDISDMSMEMIRSYYWTPEPGRSGDMNLRYIWAIGPEGDPVGWAAKHIDENKTDILSDENIFFYDDDDMID